MMFGRKENVCFPLGNIVWLTVEVDKALMGIKMMISCGMLVISIFFCGWGWHGCLDGRKILFN